MGRKLTYDELKPGMIVYVESKSTDGEFESNEFVVVLRVTEDDIKKGCNADTAGLYGFRGLWYKGNGTKRMSYGKIHHLMSDDEWVSEFTLIKPSLWGLSKKEINRIVDSPIWEIKEEFGL